MCRCSIVFIDIALWFFTSKYAAINTDGNIEKYSYMSKHFYSDRIFGESVLYKYMNKLELQLSQLSHTAVHWYAYQDSKAKMQSCSLNFTKALI